MALWIQLLSAASLSSLPLFFVCYSTLYNQKPAPDVKYNIKSEYDYIVVGAGAAGSVVASRLSEEECVDVLLVEAGPSPIHFDNIPTFGRFRWSTDIDWAYKTVPQRHTGHGLVDRRVLWPSGKGLGGSTLINAMLNVRGARANYDNWEALGAKGWGYRDVLPYFLKLEDYRVPEFVNNGYHHVGGPVTIEKPRYHPLTKDLIFQSAVNMGYKIGDSNGRRMTGFYDFSATMRDGQRCMTSKAYLVPAEDRKNLDIINQAFVTKVQIDGKRALGVEFEWQQKRHSVKARKEVILSAGTVNTAQLLMLSGIGPKEHLDHLQIHVKADLPVGKFMQDHSSVPLIFELTKDDKPMEMFETVANYTFHRTGLFASAEAIDLLGFLNTRTNSEKIDLPNVELYFLDFNVFIVKKQFGINPEVYDQVFKPYERKSVYLCFSSGVQPRSVGSVKLNSSDPHDPPLIDPNYFAVPEDLRDVVEGMKVCSKMITSHPMQKVGARPLSTLYPGCEHKAHDQDGYFECMGRSLVVTMSHEIGTAKMGHPADPTTVVDPELRVKGIKGLRVVDASVMPKIVSGNTMIPTIMIAEKASDIIKSNIRCERK